MDQGIDVQECFKIIMKALRNADKQIKKTMSPFETEANTPVLKKVEGIFNLDEKHIQYIVYKALIGMGKFPVYIEDPYGRGMSKYCDVTVYTPDWEKSLWIEIKTTGWCTEGEYSRCVKSDARKLSTLTQKGAGRYLLVTSIEDGKQHKAEWEEWFEGLKGIKFAPNLFDSFASQKFKEGEKVVDGHYAVCLFQVETQ